MLIRFLVAIEAIAALYLLAWPVPIDPVAWNPPQNLGLISPFAANDQLAAARGIEQQLQTFAAKRPGDFPSFFAKRYYNTECALLIF